MTEPMTEPQKRDTFHAAIELLVTEAVRRAHPTSPGAYAAKVRSELATNLRARGRELLNDAAFTATTLADALADDAGLGTPTPPPSNVRHVKDRHACGVCGCHHGNGWMPTPDRDDATGVIPGPIVPCPECAIERHRTHAIHGGAA